MPKQQEKEWLNTLHTRVHELQKDRDHPGFWWGDQRPIGPRITRKEIVELYEEAYGELAESFHGHQELIKELESDLSVARSSIEALKVTNRQLTSDLSRTGKRLWGVLELLERRFPSDNQS